MCEQHHDRGICPESVDLTLRERLLPFEGISLPILSAGMPPFGGSQQLVVEVAETFIRVEDIDGTIRQFLFAERPLVFFITGLIEAPEALGRVQVNFADPELEELFELDVDLLQIGRNFIEVFVTERRALIPLNRFVEFQCVEGEPEE